MSGPSAHERVKKLEARRRDHAATPPSSTRRRVGYDILAFSWITQAPGTTAHDLTDAFAAIPEIEECHHITGEADYLIKVRARDTRDLERVLRRSRRRPTCSRPRPTSSSRAASSAGHSTSAAETDEAGGA